MLPWDMVWYRVGPGYSKTLQTAWTLTFLQHVQTFSPSTQNITQGKQDRNSYAIQCLAQKTQHNNPSQGSNPGRLIRSPVHHPLGHCASHNPIEYPLTILAQKKGKKQPYHLDTAQLFSSHYWDKTRPHKPLNSAVSYRMVFRQHQVAVWEDVQ